MKFAILLIICFLSINIYGQKLENFNGNSFYNIGDKINKKLLLFLHGGVSNPFFKQNSDSISLEYLLENNSSLIPQATKNGFNIIVPITNDSLDWLNKPKQAFERLKQIVDQSSINYDEIYIGGFSDGGTGSFKIFYQNTDYFDGLIAFNGLPQHSNFSYGLDYESVTNKKIVFLGTYKDKVIPYEFLFTEYCHQKKYNPNTFFYLTSGGHSFSHYTETDITEVFEILSDRNQNTKMDPIHGFIKNDSLIELYPFRKKIVRKYGHGREVYDENRKQLKSYSN